MAVPIRGQQTVLYQGDKYGKGTPGLCLRSPPEAWVTYLWQCREAEIKGKWETETAFASLGMYILNIAFTAYFILLLLLFSF